MTSSLKTNQQNHDLYMYQPQNNRRPGITKNLELNKKLDQYHLLNHPFYKSWNEGKLTREIIKDYAEQYYQHVKAFPRYISATHSICEDKKSS